MIARLEEIDPLGADEIDEAVFLSQATGPGARGKILEGFRFAEAGEGIPHNCFNECESPQRYLPVGSYPVTKIFAKFRLEDGLSVVIRQAQYPGGERRGWSVPLPL